MKVRTLVVSTVIVVVLILYLGNKFRTGKDFRIENLEAPNATTNCRNSLDRLFVVDDTGRVCPWIELNYETGCCPHDEVQFNCSNNCKNNCCMTYAYCVSCCLNPLNPIQDNAGDSEQSDKFLYCRNVCRLSSGNVINEHQWISELKYCFPVPTQNNDSDNLENQQIDVMVNVRNINNPSKTEDKREIMKPEDNSLLFRFNQISKIQKEQEELLSQLEEEIKQLFEENMRLLEENKNLKDSQVAVVKKEESVPRHQECSSFSLGITVFVLLVGLSINIIFC